MTLIVETRTEKKYDNPCIGTCKEYPMKDISSHMRKTYTVVNRAVIARTSENRVLVL